MTAKPKPAGAQAVGPSVLKVPEGDTRERLVCETCGFVHYDNPKIVVGAVCAWDDTLLLCRRAIEPRRGYWTIPAGYIELNETVAEGAAREVLEEAGATIEIEGVIAVYSIPTRSCSRRLMTSRSVGPYRRFRRSSLASRSSTACSRSGEVSMPLA